MYSYERTASAFTDLKTLSPKFFSALNRAIATERDTKVRAALQEALEHFEQVVANLKVAEHEDIEATRE
jgi:hypothetical protein